MKLNLLTSIIVGAFSFGLISSCASDSTEVNAKEELKWCHSKVKMSLETLGAADGTADYTMMPRNIEGDSTYWHCREAIAEEWCSGFWPGILWMDYAASSDEDVRKQAELYTASLKPILDKPVFDHDLGFLFFCSCGKAFEATGDTIYKDMILQAADSLATLFNPNAGTILAWPRHIKDYGGHNTIMDTMMNLEMLFWAAKNGGDPALYDMAVRHAETTMRYHFRPDGTCYHVAVYDLESGDFMRGCTHQGYSDESVWARGQSWAVYGYTVVYRETGDKTYLDFAEKVTDAYLALLPEDYVPYWDFDDPRGEASPRDASAACVVASALLELCNYVDPQKGEQYFDAAKEMLKSLSSDSYQTDDSKPAFLLHSTGHHPAGTEIDASIVYADYYYIEALSRLAKMQN